MSFTIDAPFGLRPHNLLGSASNSTGLTAYKVQTAATAGSSSAIYQGDMVIPLANGLVDVSAADGGSVAILGVMNGCEYIDTDGKPRFSNFYPGTSSIKSGTEAKVFVYDNPFQVFEVQGDATLTNAATAQGLVHSNAEGTGFGSQNGSTGKSIGEISVSTAGATTTSDNFRILGFKHDFEEMTVTGAGVIFLVRLNVHFHLSTTGL
tara:strand:+ start:101 stop:721 length:621 start_codon:yes stop_codon:yes gene_type:complete